MAGSGISVIADISYKTGISGLLSGLSGAGDQAIGGGGISCIPPSAGAPVNITTDSGVGITTDSGSQITTSS